MTQKGNRFQGPYCIPAISVLMPVYNGEAYLREAIDSILQQSFSDFEFLIIDDGSTDGSAAIITSFSDPRIVFLQNGRNQGLVYTLNRGLQYARGIYVARMDQDDISHRERFQRQVTFMEENPAIGVCGAWMETIGDRVGQVVQYDSEPEVIKCKLLFVTVLAHPTVVFRRSVLADFGLHYSEDYQHAEDYEFWIRLSQKTNISNLSEVLHKYRLSPGQISHKHGQEQMQCHMRAQVESLRRLGLDPTLQEARLHHAISFQQIISHPQYITDAAQWIRRLQKANDSNRCYPEPAFTTVLRHYWRAVCQRNEKNDSQRVRLYWQEQDRLLANHSGVETIIGVIGQQ